MSELREDREVDVEARVLEAIADDAAAAYPYEGCGALLGIAGTRPHVTAVVPIPNSEAGTPRVRFEVSPRDYLRVEEEADRRGLALLGFWHSHPDHPARPSVTDRKYAWPGLLTVIVSVRSRVPGDVGAWEIASAEAPFVPVSLRERAARTPITTLAETAAAGGK